jgi:hypothetical protein
MSALRDRDIVAGPAVHEAARSTLRGLAYRAIAAPARPPLLARRTRARLLREAMGVGARGQAAGGDVIALASDFQTLRADLRGRRRHPANSRAGAGSPGRDAWADALLDDVLVAIVRGYEGGFEPALSATARGPDAAADRRAPTHSSGCSKRE